MSVEENFHHQMLDIYQHAGTEVGYWANYFLRGVKKHGGLNYARTALEKRKNDWIQKGFQALVDAGRVDISMESLVVRPEFASLFTDAEIAEARSRLDGVAPYALRKRVPAGEVFPDELPPGLPYTEGAIKQVTVNLYERNAKAREECLSKHGYDCAVCTMNFEKLYGEIGKKFIHAHHKKPLATSARNTSLMLTRTWCRSARTVMPCCTRPILLYRFQSCRKRYALRPLCSFKDAGRVRFVPHSGE